jgi:hypothetical protein
MIFAASCKKQDLSKIKTLDDVGTGSKSTNICGDRPLASGETGKTALETMKRFLPAPLSTSLIKTNPTITDTTSICDSSTAACIKMEEKKLHSYFPDSPAIIRDGAVRIAAITAIKELNLINFDSMSALRAAFNADLMALKNPSRTPVPFEVESMQSLLVEAMHSYYCNNGTKKTMKTKYPNTNMIFEMQFLPKLSVNSFGAHLSGEVGTAASQDNQGIVFLPARSDYPKGYSDSNLEGSSIMSNGQESAAPADAAQEREKERALERMKESARLEWDYQKAHLRIPNEVPNASTPMTQEEVDKATARAKANQTERERLEYVYDRNLYRKEQELKWQRLNESAQEMAQIRQDKNNPTQKSWYNILGW